MGANERGEFIANESMHEKYSIDWYFIGPAMNLMRGADCLSAAKVGTENARGFDRSDSYNFPVNCIAWLLQPPRAAKPIKRALADGQRARALFIQRTFAYMHFIDAIKAQCARRRTTRARFALRGATLGR